MIERLAQLVAIPSLSRQERALAEAVCAELQQAGVKPFALLTGDRTEAARSVAGALGIFDEVEAERPDVEADRLVVILDDQGDVADGLLPWDTSKLKGRRPNSLVVTASGIFLKAQANPVSR